MKRVRKGRVCQTHSSELSHSAIHHIGYLHLSQSLAVVHLPSRGLIAHTTVNAYHSLIRHLLHAWNRLLFMYLPVIMLSIFVTFYVSATSYMD